MAHTFGVLKDALNDQGRLTRPEVHRCVRQLRAMVREKARHRENESPEGDKGDVGEPTYSPAAAENVMNRLFDAVDVHNAGDVNFCEFASALSVSWRIARITFNSCWKFIRVIAECSSSL